MEREYLHKDHITNEKYFLCNECGDKVVVEIWNGDLWCFRCIARRNKEKKQKHFFDSIPELIRRYHSLSVHKRFIPGKKNRRIR